MSWIWLVVILLGVAIDYMSSDVLFVGFSLGGIAALIISLFNLSMPIQFLAFGIISVLFFILIYPKIKKRIKSENLGTKTMEEEYIGRTFIVEKEVNDKVLIKYEGVYWTVKSTDGLIKAGQKVKIVGIEGNKLLISKN